MAIYMRNKVKPEAVVVSIIVVLILGFVFVERFFGEVVVVGAVVVDKHYVPARTWTTTDTDSKGNTTTNTHHSPEKFVIAVRFDDTGGIGEHNAWRSVYYNTNVNQMIYAEVRVGYLTGWRYVTGISPKGER